MLDILELHDEVLQILLDYVKDLDENLKFGLRKSNRLNKLEEGYWFYGNDDYLAVSFWSGSDWKNKTPNIFFVITKTGRTMLEISVQDAEIKREFVQKYLVKPLRLTGDGPKYYKEYNATGQFNYLGTFRDFIEPGGDKVIIDNIISKYAGRFFHSSSEGIGFIPQEDFDETLNNILKLKSIQAYSRNEIPIKLKSFEIRGYGPINELASEEIPFGNQFVFLTGLNGTGKSSVVKALGISLSQKELYEDENNPTQPFDVVLKLYDKSGETHSKVRTENNNASSRLKPMVLALAAYGPVRLQTANSNLSDHELSRAFNKSSILDSLREDDSYLLDIHTHFKHWKQQPKHRKYIKKRKKFIEEILQDFFDSKFRVRITDSGVVYQEIDDNGKLVGSVSYRKLSTGLRSTLSLLGDLIIRMYQQQPEILDPAFFTGIVLIDEIDIHLHPVLQKRFVKELSDTFPNLQFVITTHSPIPLLGASENSVFYLVERTVEDGVTIEQIDIDITKLNPNNILTSPVFKFSGLLSQKYHKDEPLIIEDDYQEHQVKELLKKYLLNNIDNNSQAFIDFIKG